MAANSLAYNVADAEELDRGWQSEAACRGMGTEVFYTDRGESTKPPKDVCAGCPVRAACLEYALAAGEQFGVWGGLSENERRRLRDARRRRGRAAS